MAGEVFMHASITLPMTTAHKHSRGGCLAYPCRQSHPLPDNNSSPKRAVFGNFTLLYDMFIA
jgi:hypothetical protein